MASWQRANSSFSTARAVHLPPLSLQGSGSGKHGSAPFVLESARTLCHNWSMDENEPQPEETVEETPVVAERVIFARDHKSRKIIKRPNIKCCGGK